MVAGRMTGYAYFIRPVGANGPVKIGYSVTPFARVKTMQPYSPLRLELVAQIEGPPALEWQFHALFAGQHSHNEWFHGSADLSQTITAIQRGRFDVSGLPEPVDLRRVPKRARASVLSGVNVRRLGRLKRAGLLIPLEVENATNTYWADPAEKARCRKIVADFLAFHDSLRAA